MKLANKGAKATVVNLPERHVSPQTYASAMEWVLRLALTACGGYVPYYVQRYEFLAQFTILLTRKKESVFSVKRNTLLSAQ